MTNGRSKRSGKRWEDEAAKDLSKGLGHWKRIPGSGALGVQAKEPRLLGDLIGSYPWFRKDLRAEAKYGYGGNKQMTLKREWFTKIREEAAETKTTPCVLLKFRDVTTGDPSAKVICFNFDTWLKLMQDMEELHNELLETLDQAYELR